MLLVVAYTRQDQSGVFCADPLSAKGLAGRKPALDASGTNLQHGLKSTPEHDRGCLDHNRIRRPDAIPLPCAVVDQIAGVKLFPRIVGNDPTPTQVIPNAC